MTSPQACIHWHTDRTPDSYCQPILLRWAVI